MERGLLEDLCRGARIPVTKAVLVAGFPEEMEPNEIEESLDAAEILGRVKVHTRIYNRKVKGLVALCTHSKEADLDKVPKEVKVEGIPWTILRAEQSPPSVPESLEVDSLAQKLQALMVDEKRTREELILALGGDPTPAAPSLVGWAKELGNALKDALKPVHENAPYKRLRSFSGVSPVPSGEDDYETWRDFTVPLVQEWECSDAEKRKRVLESLRGPAMRIIRALKDSQPAATVQDYLTALESVYGATDSSEDLYYRFRHTYQEPHERLSDFIRRLEDLLQQVVRKEGIPAKRIDFARLDQILRGTRQDGLMLWKLQLRERAQDPPPFHKLIREIREEEERLLQADAVLQPKTAGSHTTTVLGEMEDAPSVAAALRDLTREVAMMKAQGHTVPSSREESSRRGDSQREGFCYNCGRDGHYAFDCQNKTDHARVSQRLQQTIRRLQGNTNRAWGRSNPRQGSPGKTTNRGYPRGLIGPQAIVPVRIEGRLCEALLDSGSQVTILYESYYREHLQHLPLRPLSGLTVWGIGCDSCPYRGYILLNVQFPKNVAGVNQEIETLALVCPDPKGRKYAPLILGTNANLFQRLAWKCREMAGNNYLQELPMHALCKAAYQRARGPPSQEKTKARPFGRDSFQFGDSPIPAEWKDRLCEKLVKRKAVFSMHEWDVGCAHDVEHHIQMQDGRPF